jgi:hypothetical protein
MPKNGSRLPLCHPRRSCLGFSHSAGGELEQIQFLVGGILARGSGSRTLLMTSWASSPVSLRSEELTANPNFHALSD